MYSQTNNGNGKIRFGSMSLEDNTLLKNFFFRPKRMMTIFSLVLQVFVSNVNFEIWTFGKLFSFFSCEASETFCQGCEICFSRQHILVVFLLIRRNVGVCYAMDEATGIQLLIPIDSNVLPFEWYHCLTNDK